jgi:hypothetical protein
MARTCKHARKRLIAAHMFQTGQKVVCINDEFEPWVYDLYRSLPKKDRIYTVRAVGVGRSNPKFTVNDEAEIQLKEAEFDILILLKELLNPDDPHSSVKQELGFRSERFAPLQEDTEEEEEYELVGTGKAKEWEPQPS